MLEETSSWRAYVPPSSRRNLVLLMHRHLRRTVSGCWSWRNRCTEYLTILLTRLLTPPPSATHRAS
ncbi:hypothetical protein J6590_065032 [Homalodisca vitripennis]|nr:hypothetical protein J6590_065032 [Homalodisca vitripennis]